MAGLVLALMLPAAPASAQPANDNFAAATVISSLPFSEENTDTSAATTETGENLTPSCVVSGEPVFASIDHTVWYTFTPLTTVNVGFDTFGSTSSDEAYDTVLAVYTGTALDNLVEVGCSDDSGPGFGSHSRLGLPLQGGTTYHIQVGSWTGTVNEEVVPPDTGSLDVHAGTRTFAPGVVRGNVWYLNGGFDGGAEAGFSYGSVTDYPLVGTWSGDGISKPVLVRGNVWFLNFWFDGSPEVPGFGFGSATDFPLMADWEGDTLSSPGVVRGNVWYWINSTTGAVGNFPFGRSTDYPIVGDWDGDGDETPGVIRGNVFYLNNNVPPSGPTTVFPFGRSTDFPVVGDWDGDGDMTVGVVRGNIWFLNNSLPPSGATTVFAFGSATDFPIVGDWDGAVTGFGVGAAAESAATGPRKPMRPLPWSR